MSTKLCLENIKIKVNYHVVRNDFSYNSVFNFSQFKTNFQILFDPAKTIQVLKKYHCC